MKILHLFMCVILFCAGLTGCSQKAVYTTAADSVNLNKEYKTVSRELAKLKTELIDAESKVAVYEARARQADAEAKRKLLESSEQAAKASSANNVKQAKRAENRADDASEAAEDAKTARDRINDLHEKIKTLNKNISSNEQRLRELDEYQNRIKAASARPYSQTDSIRKPLSPP